MQGKHSQLVSPSRRCCIIYCLRVPVRTTLRLEVDQSMLCNASRLPRSSIIKQRSPLQSPRTSPTSAHPEYLLPECSPQSRPSSRTSRSTAQQSVSTAPGGICWLGISNPDDRARRSMLLLTISMACYLCLMEEHVRGPLALFGLNIEATVDSTRRQSGHHITPEASRDA